MLLVVPDATTSAMPSEAPTTAGRATNDATARTVDGGADEEDESSGDDDGSLPVSSAGAPVAIGIVAAVPVSASGEATRCSLCVVAGDDANVLRAPAPPPLR